MNEQKQEHEVKGVSGSIECDHWHTGDSVRLHIHYHKGHHAYIVTNQERINELWLPALQSPLSGSSWSKTIPEGEGVEIVWNDGLLTIRPSFNGMTYGNVALFTREQAKRITAMLKV